MEITTTDQLKAHYGPLCEALVECACQKASSEVEDLRKQLATAIAERETLSAELGTVKGELEQFRAAQLRAEQLEEITKSAKEILGEEYEPSEKLLENLLALYEGECYKTVLTSMGELKPEGQREERPAPEGERLRSQSGTKGTNGSTQTTIERPAIGYHNRLWR